MSIIGGKLKFKSCFQAKLNSQESKLKKEKEKQDLLEKNDDDFPDLKTDELEQLIIEYEPQAGTGRILTSGKTVHGKDTIFTKEIRLGDEIVITHPSSLEKESRKINAVLSDRSIGIDEPFSTDLVSYTQFEFKKQTEIKNKEMALEQKYQNKILDMSKKIKKKDDNKSTLEFREKKGMWGYKYVKEEINGELSKEALLDLRSKKNRDKFCWI